MKSPTIINLYKEPFEVYIGRNPEHGNPKWGNPFNQKELQLWESLALYEDYIRNSPTLWDSLDELDGKTLGCYCKPKPCHGDVLVNLFNEKFNIVPLKESNEWFEF